MAFVFMQSNCWQLNGSVSAAIFLLLVVLSIFLEGQHAKFFLTANMQSLQRECEITNRRVVEYNSGEPPH